MRMFLHLLLCATLSGAMASLAIAADADTVQLGGGYEVSVACEGTKIRFDRLGSDEVRVSCHPTVARAVRAVTAMHELRLDPGESATLFCQGLKLVTRKQGGARVRANCRAIPAPVI
jgi:hypothetical protein